MTSKKKLLILTFMGNALVVSNTTNGAILSNNPNNSQIHEQTISATTQDAIQNLAETAPELILQYTFSSTNDESGIYNGQLGGSAKLSTLNNIPILELGNNNGYFDMGENVGDVISSLNEAFTISMNVFIPSNYGLGQNGNFIFNFGHSSETGYMFFSANNTRYSITPTNYSRESTLTLSQFFTQGEWVNLTYTQNKTQGTIYLNGKKMKTGNISMLPSDLGRTTQNWLGRSPYNGDVFLRNACYNDVRIYTGEISEAQISTAYNIENLNKLNESIHKEQINDFIKTHSFNFNEIRSNITFPTAFDNGISATWESLNQTYIKNNGEVTRPKQGENNVNVTLKATFTKGNVSQTAEYTAVVLAELNDNEALEYDLANLNLNGNLNNLRSDLTLPTSTSEGTIITWSSSNKDFISDNGNLLQLSPSGSGKKTVTMTATGYRKHLKKTKDFQINIAEDENYDSYLFVYFPNNADENLYYAISKDGYNYTPLNNGQRVMWSDSVAIKKGIRDPHILRGQDGKTFYMVATDMRCAEGWASNRGIVMYKSTDLIHWQHSTVHFPNRFPEWKNVTRVWAPETIWDPDYQNEDGSKGRYMIYFSLLTNDGKCPYDKVYYCYANDDFTGLISDPVFLYDRGSATIDSDIIYDERDGTYHMIYKNEGSGGICQVTSKRLTAEPGMPEGSQWSTPSGNLQQTNVAVEGGGMYKLINSDTWILMYDCYTSGYYQFCSSDDLINFTLRAQTTTSGAFTPRHGTVIPISKEETDALFAAFPTDNMGTDIADFNNRNIIKENIIQEDGAIYLPVRYGTDLTQFDPELVVPAGCQITPSGKQDFSKGPVEYTISNQDDRSTYSITAELCSNPIISGFYADPEIIFSQKTGRFYIYSASADESQNSTGIDVYSSADLVYWKNEGYAFNFAENSSNNVEYSSTAPAVEEKYADGKYIYYMYYNAYNKNQGKNIIGVAVSDNPAGPFKDYGSLITPSDGNEPLYPDVFTDKENSKTYLYWGNSNLSVSTLNEDLISCESSTDITPVTNNQSAFNNSVHVFYRRGIYYYLWNDTENGNTDNTIVYGTSTSPQGPITVSENNIVLSSVPESGIYGTSHCAVIQNPDKDEWYIVYHRINNKYINNEPDLHREICIDKLEFDTDGSIIKTVATNQGINPITLTEYIENELTEQPDAQITVEYNINYGWGTLMLPFDSQIPDGMTVYSCHSITGNYLSLDKTNSICANTPYIVSGNGTYTFKGTNTAESDTYTSGLLTGIYSDMKAPVNSYVLQNQNNETAFYKVENIQPWISSNHAYLQLPSTSETNLHVLYLDKDITNTDLTTVDNGNQSVNVCNLNGMTIRSNVKRANALDNLPKGIYIINGQKVIK